ncbi:MAG: hypothetical protein A3I24_03705 [Candidatus Harrisonbacteria bacterium RIFCSPLOWO2_02_FULL_41_13b]|uniref:Uncharacterized protein n=1 Tax=Candidatus Harrisonbacteria bacterium RIFCSPLOWO2_02_FULL_41_13b TaxID=1798409 RepID=A0A1G1ZRL6_9BACT|nr:MAG: hypothetical protein A3I24_03705 [Candidatus Harrisonbacteria bacterium RIFCSPLOWO2_02_FULL_41_13b]
MNLKLNYISILFFILIRSKLDFLKTCLYLVEKSFCPCLEQIFKAKASLSSSSHFLKFDLGLFDKILTNI